MLHLVTCLATINESIKEWMKKVEFLKAKLSELIDFKENLCLDNIKEFEKLKSEISKALNEKQRIRFNQIEFYSETEEYQDIQSDGLPF